MSNGTASPSIESWTWNMLPKRQRAKHTRWVAMKSTDGGDDCLIMSVSWRYFVLETRCGVLWRGSCDSLSSKDGDITPSEQYISSRGKNSHEIYLNGTIYSAENRKSSFSVSRKDPRTLPFGTRTLDIWWEDHQVSNFKIEFEVIPIVFMTQYEKRDINVLSKYPSSHTLCKLQHPLHTQPQLIS